MGVGGVGSVGVNMRGEEFEGGGRGNGGVDGGMKGVKEIMKGEMSLKEFRIEGMRKGSEDVGKVEMEVE